MLISKVKQNVSFVTFKHYVLKGGELIVSDP